MKLAAIFCVWDDWQLLIPAMANIRPVVDQVIIVGSEYSNYGEYSPVPVWGMMGNWYVHYSPNRHASASHNETSKRNIGLAMAKSLGATHFIMMDSDEFYDREQFIKEKQRFIHNPDLAGLVCASQVYFKSPGLTIGLDKTRVPFIHKITPDLKHTFNKQYPFAWEGKEIRIDPTRSLNINSGVEWSDIIMHHYSWVRPDFGKKIRNSTAKANLERSPILKDLALAKEGYFCEFYGKELVRARVDFNVPDFQPVETESGQRPNPAG